MLLLLQITTLAFFCASPVAWCQPSDFVDDSTYIDLDDLGPYENMVEATKEILPVIADGLDVVSKNARLSDDPLSPKSLLEVMMAFMPISRKVLLAAAKAEGKIVRQVDLDRLEEIQRDLPNAFDYVSKLKKLDFRASGSVVSNKGSIPPYSPVTFDSSTSRSDVNQVTVLLPKVTPLSLSSYIPAKVATKQTRVPENTSGNVDRDNSFLSSIKLVSPLTTSASNTHIIQGSNLPNRRSFIPAYVRSIHNSRATDVPPDLTSQPQHPTLSSARVLRTAAPESRRDPSGIDSHSYIKLPYSKALFIRHDAS